MPWEFAPAVRRVCVVPVSYTHLLPSLAKVAPVVIVEGEKAADAAATLLPDHPVICWQGGAQAVAKADFSPLAGRDVWLWADADEAGTKAMDAVGAALFRICLLYTSRCV